MRMSLISTLLAGTFALAGCTNGTPEPGASPSPTPSPTPSPGAVAACVVGTWHSVEAKGSANIVGGGGVVVEIAASGAVTMDFANMQPATFAVKIGNADVLGKFVYNGKANGTVQTTGETSGTWEPVGTIDWSTLTVTADLTEPVQARPLNNLPLADYLGPNSDATGGVVDVAPLLGKGTYTCEGATLVITPETDKGLTWTLARRD